VRTGVLLPRRDHRKRSPGGAGAYAFPAERLTSSGAVGRRQRIRLLDADASLGDGLSDDRARVAHAALVVAAVDVPEGEWDPPREDGALGYLVVDGLLRRDVYLDESSKSVELVGAGDVLRPWSEDPAGSLPVQVDWRVLRCVRLAVLGAGFARAAASFPEVLDALLQRAVQRSYRHSVREAIMAAPRVEPRLIAILWVLADRWGVVTPKGVELRLPLTHALLADMIGMRRPSVTITLGRLRDSGAITVGRDRWLLHGEPPVEPSDFESAPANGD
jgi:CRP/FNR family transcriptional regulator, cyclic AMP receptor protein